jgi:L-rhamnose isomerase
MMKKLIFLWIPSLFLLPNICFSSAFNLCDLKLTQSSLTEREEIEDDVYLEIITDKNEYKLGEEVNISFLVHNNKNEDVTLSFHDSYISDFIIYSQSDFGEYGCYIHFGWYCFRLQIVIEKHIPAGETKVVTYLTWDQTGAEFPFMPFFIKRFF